MAKRIFISFDFDHDRNYRYLLSALKANPRTDLTFDDVTPSEIQSANVAGVKAVLTARIRAATHTLVIVGEHANSFHPDRALIGERNWQWWEINASVAEGNKFIGVKIARTNDIPVPMQTLKAAWAHSFAVDSIIGAVDSA